MDCGFDDNLVFRASMLCLLDTAGAPAQSLLVPVMTVWGSEDGR